MKTVSFTDFNKKRLPVIFRRLNKVKLF